MATRRERAVAYLDKKYGGNRARIIKRTGLTKGRISQIYDENEPFGERAARSLAQTLDLPDDTFEADPPADITAAGMALARIYDQLPDNEQHVLMRTARSALADVNGSHGQAQENHEHGESTPENVTRLKHDSSRRGRGAAGAQRSTEQWFEETTDGTGSQVESGGDPRPGEEDENKKKGKKPPRGKR